MEPLPRGANFVRGKVLWEIGLHLAGDPAISYGGDRDLSIVVGSGSGASFHPSLRFATGSPHLATSVARGDVELAFVNPSGLLTQAYRGTGLFREALPIRVVAVWPTWDRFVYLLHPRVGVASLAEVREKRYPLRLSIREDPTHSTRVLVDQTLALYGFTLDDLLGWGGSLQLNGPPNDRRRMQALQKDEVDAVFDEGINTGWAAVALAAGLRPLRLEDAVQSQLQELGWRVVTLQPGEVEGLQEPYACVDYSGWPLYTRAALPDEVAYRVCDALAARADEIPWERSFTGLGQLWQDTVATPVDVPLHPGAARWYQEHAASLPPARPHS